MVKGPATTCPLSTAIPSSKPSNNNPPNQHRRAYGGPSCIKKTKKKRNPPPLKRPRRQANGIHQGNLVTRGVELAKQGSPTLPDAKKKDSNKKKGRPTIAPEKKNLIFELRQPGRCPQGVLGQRSNGV